MLRLVEAGVSGLGGDFGVDSERSQESRDLRRSDEVLICGRLLLAIGSVCGLRRADGGVLSDDLGNGDNRGDSRSAAS